MKKNLLGFTLLEIIATLLIASVLAAMVIPYFGTALTKSSTPIFNLQAATNLNAVMARIKADHRKGTPLASIQDKVNKHDDDYLPGVYVIEKNDFIKFSSNAEQDATGPGDPQNILKVTIKNNLGETLTCLFSE